jgi:voltage-gated potassium channel
MKNLIQRLINSNYSILLILLFLLFICRPYNYGGIYDGIWKSTLMGTLIISIFTCNHTKKIRNIVSIIAIPTFIITWINLYIDTPIVFIPFIILSFSFMLISTVSIVYDVILNPKVTFETLRGVVCAFFLIGFMFAYLYLFVEVANPGSFIIRGEVIPTYPHVRYFSEMLYYSFNTLLTIGSGEIIPHIEWGQTVVVLEVIVGQFYMAILVARIVAVYTILSDKTIVKALKSDFNTDANDES